MVETRASADSNIIRTASSCGINNLERLESKIMANSRYDNSREQSSCF